MHLKLSVVGLLLITQQRLLLMVVGVPLSDVKGSDLIVFLSLMLFIS